MRYLSLLTGAFALLVATSAAPAEAAYETRAGSAYVLDMGTGTVLLEKNADVPLPPASMSKLMTLYMLFEALRDGRVTMDTRFGVSDRAASMGGSTMFLDQSDRPTVEQLIKGIVVQSGNDATVVVAEGLAGSEEAFASAMTERARELGLEDTTLANASGWPHPDHRMSARDLGRLASLIISEFPDLYEIFSMREYPFDGRAPDNRFNRNPLLDLGIGADGLKTGHTEEAGYGLVGSAQQGDRRVVFVVTGLDSTQARAQESERIVNWAFRQFTQRRVAREGEVFAEAEVWMGDRESVALVAETDHALLVPTGQGSTLEGRVVYEGPVEAPVAAGDRLGELVIARENMPEARIPLVAAADVGAGGFIPRLRTAASVLAQRALGEAMALR